MKYAKHFIPLLAAILFVSCHSNAFKSSNKNHLQQSRHLIKECDRLNNSGKYDSTLVVGKKGLAASIANNEKKETAWFCYHVGRALDGLRRIDSAIYYYRKGEQIGFQIKSPENFIYPQTRLSGIYYDYGKPDSVNVYKDKMLSEADTIKNVALKMRLIAKLADVYATTDQPEKALKAYFQSLAYAKSQKDSLRIGMELGDIGEVYTQLTDFNKAVNYSLQGVVYLKRYPHTAMVDYNDIGTDYVDLKQYDKSIIYFQKTIRVAAEFKDTAYLQATYISICSPLIELKQYDRATKYLKQALLYYNKTGYTVGLIYVLNMFGKIEAANNNYEKALDYYKKAEVMAQKTGHMDSDMFIYSLLAGVAGKTKQFEQAYQYEHQYNRLRDSLTQTTTKKNIADLEIKYQTNEKEQKIVLLNQAEKIKDIEIKDQNRKWWFLFAAVCFLLITAFLLYRGYVLKKTSNQQLEDKNNALKELNEQLNEANSSKTKLFSILSHDLRAPINSIFQFINLQKNYPKKLNEEDGKRHNEQILQSAENLMETMEDILTWSKSQMDSFSLKISKINVDELISNTITLHENFAEERQITIKKDCSTDLEIYTDVNFLKVVLRNIVSNGIKFTPAGGSIKISAEKQGDGVCFRIYDSGIGMSEEQIGSLFEWSSIRSDTSGLGLKLAKEFINRLGGSIRVDSKLNMGTIFIISVPVLEAATIKS
jgi:signal transduction histidine kinase